MNPRFHIWNGWDLMAVVWVLFGILILAFLPTAMSDYAVNERTLLMLLVLLAGPFFLLAGVGRRGQHVDHIQDHPRPFDAPD